MNKAANNPLSDFPVASYVSKYVTQAVNAEKTGAVKTHTFLILIGIEIQLRNQ